MMEGGYEVDQRLLDGTAYVMALRLSIVFLWLVRMGNLLETGQCEPNSGRSTVLFGCQLPTNFHNISIV